jgi:hypothetical protein
VVNPNQQLDILSKVLRLGVVGHHIPVELSMDDYGLATTGGYLKQVELDKNKGNIR